MVIYTDGNCIGNPGPGGFGVVVVNDDGSLNGVYKSDRCEHTTNNREEMKAILHVMKYYGDQDPEVYSDSQYAIMAFEKYLPQWKKNGWRKKRGGRPENLDLIKQYYEMKRDGMKITLHKVAGHSGVKWNEMADSVAKSASGMEV